MLKIYKLLLSHKNIEINIENIDGYTPLHIAFKIIILNVLNYY